MKLKLRHLFITPIFCNVVSTATAEELPERKFFAVDQESIFLATEVDKSYVRARLGNLVVVDKKHLKNDPNLQQKSGLLKSLPGSLVIRDDSGRHGIADGTLLVRLREGESISVFALDYQLQVVETFRHQGMGRVLVPDVNKLLSVMEILSADLRTLYVEPNARYFDIKPQ